MFRESWHRRRYKAAVEFVGGAKKVLDIGCCGPCKTIEDGAFLKMLGRGTGMDLKKCRQADFDFRQGSIERIPFPPKHFDAVVATEIFEHVPKAEKARAEVHRVLRDNGVFVFSSFSGSLFAQLVWFLFTNIAGSNFKHDHVNIKTKKEWKKFFRGYFAVEMEKSVWGLTDVIKFRKIPRK